MSLFDFIRCEVPLPEASATVQLLEFKTDSFENAGNHSYEIRANGSLWLEHSEKRIETNMDGVEVEALLKYGEALAYTGDIHFFAESHDADGSRIEYISHFYNGLMRSIRCIEAKGIYHMASVTLNRRTISRDAERL